MSSWRIWYKENSDEGILRHKEIEDESQRSGLLKTERGFKPLVNGLEYEIAVSGNLRSGGRVDSEKVLATPRPPEQPVITQVIAGDESLEVHWTYSGDESELSSWRIWYKENSDEGIYTA